MILFPYRAQIKLHKIPAVTLAVAAACVLVYFFQARNEARIEAYAKSVCSRPASAGEGGAAGADYRSGGAGPGCEQALRRIYAAPDPARALQWRAGRMVRAGDAAGAERLRRQYRAFAAGAPVSLTARLYQDRGRFDPAGMLTSVFAHASWEHVIFNVVFFFAFAASVELIIGPVLFVGVIVALAFGIGLVDELVAHWQSNPAPSLGLSGVVMGMLALFVYFLPRARIRFFFWFMLSVGTIGISAWIVALFYVGWNLYDQLTGAGGPVDFVAHLAGAGFGFAIGYLFFRGKRHWAGELVQEPGLLDPQREESGLDRLNAIMVAPAIAGLAFVAGIALMVLVVALVQRFWVSMLMAAPALAAGYQIYRLRRAGRPRREQYTLGMQALERQEYAQALAHLVPLADENDTRALFALGNLHAGAPGALRDEAKAVALYSRAAERGHAAAQYALGMHYADGRGVAGNMPKALACYEKAALAGLPDAANSLGYLYENGIGIPADREKAIEWYYRAGRGYRAAGRAADVQAIVRHLESIAAGYPAVLVLVAKLKAALPTVQK